mgnify:CR=1 FL=1
MTPGSLLVSGPHFEKYLLVISLSSLDLSDSSYEDKGIFEATALFSSSARKMVGELETNYSSYKSWRILSHAG